MKPVSPKVSGEIKELADGLKDMKPADILAEASKQIDGAKQALEQALTDIAIETSKKAAAKAAGRWGIGALFGPIGATVATVINVVDTAITAIEVAGNLKDFKDEIGQLKDMLDDFPKQVEDLAKEAAENPQKAIADAMSILSRMNDCVRARRCQLVPMEETHRGPKPKDCSDFGEDKEELIPTGPATGKGCCPGQTGHHVLPSSMFKNCKEFTGAGKHSKSCAHQKAPTICVEGVNNSHGSHGKIHGQLETQMKKYPSETISYDEAIEEGVDSVKKVFPEQAAVKNAYVRSLRRFMTNTRTVHLWLPAMVREVGAVQRI